MLARIRSGLTYANVMATIACFATVAGGTYAVAAIPGDKGKVKACYAKKGKAKGQLRVVDASKRCRRSERALSWSQRGPAGATGRRGATGRVSDSNHFSKAESDARYLSHNATASDAQNLDGADSSAFVQGGGLLVSARRESALDSGAIAVLGIPGFGGVEASCSSSGAEIGFRPTSRSLELFTAGSDPPNQDTPQFRTLAAGELGAIATNISSDDSEVVTLQLGSGADPRVATVTVSGHRPDEGSPCIFYAQALVQTPVADG
jgi:hypothetical protein